MMNIKQGFLAAPLDQYVSPAQSARCLMLAVLDRALRDLHPKCAHKDRVEALAWFSYKGEPRPNDLRFTFKQIVDFLEFSAAECAYIATKVEAATYGINIDQVFTCEPLHRHRSWV